MNDAIVCDGCGAAAEATDEVCGNCGRPTHRLRVSESSAGASRSPVGGPHPVGGGWSGSRPDHEKGEWLGERAGAPQGAAPALQRLGRQTVVEGQARALQSRSEQRGEGYGETIWSFRVERHDEAGNRVQLIPVEIRGLTFEGSINEGDWVRAEGRVRAGTFRANVLENRTTGAVVRAKGYSKLAAVVFSVIFLIIISLVAVVAFAVIRAASDQPPNFRTPPAELRR